MKVIFLIALILSASIFGYTQTKTGFVGAVMDSIDHTPLEKATVAIINIRDSSLISYTLTGENGKFRIGNLKTLPSFKILISHVGFNTKSIILNNITGIQDLGRVSLLRKSLKEVVIHADVSPVIMKKDTIEFDAQAFKTRPNAILEELLKKLPGMQVNQDGTIIIFGKIISQIKVNGKDFFGGNTKIATKNLDADIISKIQVYDDRNNNFDQLKPEYEVQKILNLKLKKSFTKNAFGKVYAGYGSRKRYESGGMYNLFRDTLQVSMIGFSNNLDKSAFNEDELGSMGGFDRGGRESIYNGAIALGDQSYGGIESVISTGINVNNDFSSRLKMNFQYFYSHIDDIYKTSTSQSQSFTDTILYDNSENTRNQVTNKHAISATLEYQTKKGSQIRYNPIFNIAQISSGYANISRLSNNFIDPTGKVENLSKSNFSEQQFQHNFNYYVPLKKNRSFNLSQSINYRPSHTNASINGNLISYINASNSDLVNKLQKDRNMDLNINLTLGWRAQLSENVTGSLTGSSNYAKNRNGISVYEQNIATGKYDDFIVDQSNILERVLWEERINSELTIKLGKKSSLTTNLNLRLLQNQNHFTDRSTDISKQYTYMLPAFRFIINKLNINYESNLTLPNTSDLQPITITNNPRFVFTGNSGLNPTLRHNLSLNFYTYKAQSGTNMSFNINSFYEENSILRKRQVDNDGIEFISPINKDGKYNINIGASFGKTFKKQGDWGISINTYLNGSLNHNLYDVNNKSGFLNTFSEAISQSVSLAWKDIFEINPTYTFTQNKTRYQSDQFSALDYATHSARITLACKITDKLSLESTYNYNNNPLVKEGFARNFNLLNGFLSYRIQKKSRGLVKLSCFDILDQNINFFRSVNQNIVIDQQNQILNRYFLLTYIYRFNKASN